MCHVISDSVYSHDASESCFTDMTHISCSGQLPLMSFSYHITSTPCHSTLCHEFVNHSISIHVILIKCHLWVIYAIYDACHVIYFSCHARVTSHIWFTLFMTHVYLQLHAWNVQNIPHLRCQSWFKLKQSSHVILIKITIYNGTGSSYFGLMTPPRSLKFLCCHVKSGSWQGGVIFKPCSSRFGPDI